jgi:ABC-type Na+ efflux pump permease subunit
VIKDLKAQLKREAAKYDQAQVDIQRLENALKLQAEAMLASEQVMGVVMMMMMMMMTMMMMMILPPE